jgi:hypothetical protein
VSDPGQNAKSGVMIGVGSIMGFILSIILMSGLVIIAIVFGSLLTAMGV